MAVREILIDDFDGSEDSTIETFTFSIQERRYKMDLNETNRELFESAIKPFIEKAEPDTQFSPAYDSIKVREWAEANKIPVNPRGRIKADVIDAYLASSSKGKTKAKK